MKRVIVTGSRYTTDWQEIRHALFEVMAQFPGERIVLVHGDAAGADRIAASIANRRPKRFSVEAHPADWKKYPRAAGPIRNREMMSTGADLVLAFPFLGKPNKGTNDCIGVARKVGIPVHIVPVER